MGMNEIPLCVVVFSLGIPEEERKLPFAADIIGNIGQIYKLREIGDKPIYQQHI